MAGLPRPFVVGCTGLGHALQKQVKWLHYWLRKGNEHKAGIAAREAAHLAHIALRTGVVDVEATGRHE